VFVKTFSDGTSEQVYLDGAYSLEVILAVSVPGGDDWAGN
jgi:hypothetical protein